MNCWVPKFCIDVAGLQRQHASDEKAQDRDDRHRRVADQVALLDKSGELPRQCPPMAQRPGHHDQGGAEGLT
jgi:hypothetical protein